MGILEVSLVVTIILKLCGVIATWRMALLPLWIWLGLIALISIKDWIMDNI